MPSRSRLFQTALLLGGRRLLDISMRHTSAVTERAVREGVGEGQAPSRDV